MKLLFCGHDEAGLELPGLDVRRRYEILNFMGDRVTGRDVA
ncbi:MAG: hypothetical protein ACTSXX_14325 [Candidatus Baldrarchaeia archaeon]